MNFEHTPVFLKEAVDGLQIKPDGCYVDCTVGGGGHSLEILKRLPEGRLIAIDQDEEALAAARETLKDYTNQVDFVHANFVNLPQILADLDQDQVDGILMDLGVSSHQLDEGERGFSYHADAPLDMRMDQKADTPTAADIVNTYSEDELTHVFYQYGEERWARRIARFIVTERNEHRLETTQDLVTVIKKAIPKKVRMRSKHPARRVFQALRIEVNHELDVLRSTLESGVDHLKPGGRICVISFQSLEDRIVKEDFRDMAQGCVCPPDFPVCVCGQVEKIKIITSKPIMPTEEEVERNPRSRSAKLRIAEKVEEDHGRSRL